MANRCCDCAFCSEYYLTSKDVCELDEHEIRNIYSENCSKFVRADDDEEQED